MEAFLRAQNWVLCCLHLWSMTLFKGGAPALNSWMIWRFWRLNLAIRHPWLNVVADDIHAFAANNNMRLNPRKCKSMTADFFFTTIVAFRAQLRLVGPVLNRSLHLSSRPGLSFRGPHLGSALRLHSEEGQQTALCTETTQEVQSSVGWYCSYLLRANSLYTRVRLRCLCWLA